MQINFKYGDKDLATDMQIVTFSQKSQSAYR